MDKWIIALKNELRLRNLSAGTIKQYTSAVGRLRQAWPRLPVEAITEEHIKSFLLECLDDGRKPESIRVLVAAFRFFFVYVVKQPGVVAHVAFPKSRKRIPSAPSKDEIARIFAAAAQLGRRPWLVCALAYGCGLRVSEIAALHSWDICSKEGFLIVRCGKGAKERKTLLPDEVLQGEPPIVGAHAGPPPATGRSCPTRQPAPPRPSSRSFFRCAMNASGNSFRRISASDHSRRESCGSTQSR